MNYINTELCKKCGGKYCCQQMGGTFIPEQFEDLTVNGLIEAVKNLKLSIDWYEGCPLGSDRSRTLYLRTRNIDSPVIDPSWGGYTCVHLNPDKGCDFTYEERPFECQKLIPKFENGEYKCYIPKQYKATKAGLSSRWIPYQHILLKVEDSF